jgi:hypothetical protein
MVKITIYAEGGGDIRLQQANFRKSFIKFFERLGIKLSVVACGGRLMAYKDFCKALKNCKKDEYCLLLVDSEAPVTNISKWQHVLLQEGDKWEKPDNATEEHLHFMVECMEAWFMADKEELARYYGKDFNQNVLSKNTNIENISKQDLYNGLDRATRDTTKGKYSNSKGGHSFDILGKIDAHKVIAHSSYAKKLYDTLQQLLENPIPSS